VIGLERKVPGSLADFQVDCRVVPCKPDGAINLENLLRALSPRTKVVAFQRSCGYEWSLSRSVGQLKEAYAAVKRVRPDICCFTDNCYGEFVEDQEPTAFGCDLMAGSLIKNPGGGLAPTGGYIVGRREYVELAATRVTAPGIGGHVGATLDLPRLLLQGFYLAPHFVAEALAGTEVAGRLLNMAGFEINPAPGSQRTDLVVAVRMRSSEQLIAFCQGLQRACPVNGHVRPEASEMPGYDSQVIMAGGSFIQGATLEFSADAPIREPYTVYIQGGLTREQAELGILAGLENLRQMGLLRA
jgi:cystathionine beta-lyase family protein involved in aluminum resistance